MASRDLDLEGEAALERGSQPGGPGFFSSARVFSPPVGPRVTPEELGGYYIDFRVKQEPSELGDADRELHVATAQWGLGCYERYLAGEGERWLATALRAAEHLADRQVRDGILDGGWVHHSPIHTYRLEPPWMSGMAQGEGASLLLRVYAETGDERLAQAALRALRPLAIPTASGGLRVPLGSGFFLEEYPTHPPSMVLNGGIFALWAYRDVALALGDADANREFEEGVDALADNIGRWDTGSWTRYDLFPHPVTNVASSFYHVLHINQVRAMQLVAPRPDLSAAVERWERYRESGSLRRRALARKALFRLVVPRNRYLAHRLPFGRIRRRV
ncbi:MAG: D-glucuronyl C5-epimerase family protein [Solirubrobacterales bacterium]